VIKREVPPGSIFNAINSWHLQAALAIRLQHARSTKVEQRQIHPHSVALLAMEATQGTASGRWLIRLDGNSTSSLVVDVWLNGLHGRRGGVDSSLKTASDRAFMNYFAAIIANAPSDFYSFDHGAIIAGVTSGRWATVTVGLWRSRRGTEAWCFATTQCAAKIPEW